MSTQQPTNNNRPVETLRDGAATIKLWKHEGKNGEIYINASVGRIYKDRQTGEWKESKSFNGADLAKLEGLIPKAQEMAHVHEYAFNAQRMEQARAWQAEQLQQQAPSQPEQPSPDQRHTHPTQAMPTQQEQPLTAQRPAQILEQQDMAAAREQAMAQAAPTEALPDHTQEHAPAPTHDPTR